MLRTHPNISVLFSELSFLERPRAAAREGFDAVECYWPFDGPEPTIQGRAAFVSAVRDAGVHLAALNFDAGDLAHGERGLFSIPGQDERVRRAVDAAVDIAGELGCPVLTALYGNRLLGIDPRAQDDLAVQRLTYAAEVAERVGATVVLEALNPTFRRSGEVFERISEGGAHLVW